MTKRPLFSICHTTARPDAWRACRDLWMSRAENPRSIEYVLCIDERWGFAAGLDGAGAADFLSDSLGSYPGRVVYNTGRKCMVDGANIAASASSGQILIINSDDMEPPENWDRLLLDALGTVDLGAEFVLQVSSGTKADDRGLMVLQILSRSRYERYGYALYPEYRSLYADDDFSACAVKDGVVIDASHVTVQHKHPLYISGGEWDAVYSHENASSACADGRRIFERRRNEWLTRSETIAVVFPGEAFHRLFKCHWSALQAHLIKRGMRPIAIYGEMSNPHGVRELLRQQVLESPTPIDLVLWLDDDQLLSCDQFERLLLDLDQSPEFAIVAGWTWCDTGGDPVISAGIMADDSVRPVSQAEMMSAPGLLELEWTGFPAVLMRASLLRDCGPLPFAPILAPKSAWGYTGEDIAFCVNARARVGARVFVDPKVFLPHLKVKALGLGGAPVAIEHACMQAAAMLAGRVVIRQEQEQEYEKSA